ncbi:g11111 [Coccomyxa elongata]
MSSTSARQLGRDAPSLSNAHEACLTPAQGLLLNFKDAELEAAFRRDWAKASFRADCGLYLLALSLWCLVWHTLQSAGESGRAKWAAGNALMCSCTLVFMRLNQEAFMRRRTFIIASTKILATVLATEIMLLPGYPTASWLGLFSALGVLSKVCMLLFTACFMQIPFSEHLFVQGLQVGYCILHNGRMCSALETRYLGIRERCLAVARALSAVSYEAQAPLKLRSRTLSGAHACESVNAYLQIIFGYVLSMLLLHELEGRSRADFLRSRGRIPAPETSGGLFMGWLAVPVFMLLSALITWELVEAVWELADTWTH